MDIETVKQIYSMLDNNSVQQLHATLSQHNLYDIVELYTALYIICRPTKSWDPPSLDRYSGIHDVINFQKLTVDELFPAEQVQKIVYRNLLSNFLELYKLSYPTKDDFTQLYEVLFKSTVCFSKTGPAWDLYKSTAKLLQLPLKAHKSNTGVIVVNKTPSETFQKTYYNIDRFSSGIILMVMCFMPNCKNLINLKNDYWITLLTNVVPPVHPETHRFEYKQPLDSYYTIFGLIKE